MENEAVKKCPDCNMTNRETNIFCPQCGYCFLDEPEKSPEKKRSISSRAVENNKRLVIVLAVAIIILAAMAGVASFLISREIQRSMLVTVETGTRWKCSQCGDIYKERLAVINVEKSESDQYKVETIDGTCFRCLYGDQVGDFVEKIGELALHERFGSDVIEMNKKAAEFISANPGLFPSAGLEEVEGIAIEVDPRLVERDYADYSGTLLYVEGKVAESELFKSSDGTEITYVELVPMMDGEELDVDFTIIYFGVSDVLRGDIADCYVLPIDLVKYQDGDVEKSAVIAIGIYMTGELP